MNPPPVETRHLQSGPGTRIQTLLRHDCRPRGCEDIDIVTDDGLE